MLNIKELVESGKIKDLKRRGVDFNLSDIKKMIKNRGESHSKVDSLRSSLKECSNQFSLLKRSGENTDVLTEEIRNIKKEISTEEKVLEALDAAYKGLSFSLPNIPEADVPAGDSDAENVCIKTWGTPLVDSNFKNHVELNEDLKIFDFDRAAKVSGSGFCFYKGKGALLERALLNYMIDIHIKNGLEFIMPPLLVKDSTVLCAGQLPKFKDQLYKVEDEELYLIPTSESPLIGMYMNEIIDSLESPKRMCGISACFRTEAGSAGVSDRGIIRSHQFNKVEMITLCKEDDEVAELQKMIDTAEFILRSLELPYRILKLCTGDLPFASKKTFDIEVWLPGQNRYYECSSISTCGVFQSKRGLIRYRDEESNIQYPITLNGSGIATSRLMVSILETGQQDNGRIKVPNVLVPYTGFEYI